MSYDPVKSAAEGAAKGAVQGFLDWSEERIKRLASKLRDGNLAFIQDEKTIKLVKEQYRSGELSFYKEYIKDKEALFLLKMGLTLRRLEKDKEEKRKSNLRSKLLDKYNIRGLHIAQFVENGLLNRYIGMLIDDMTSLDKFKEDVMYILNNIEKHVLFVKSQDSGRYVIHESTTTIASHKSMIFIISGISSAAETVRNCEERLEEFLTDYKLEKISSKEKENLFFKRVI